MRTSSAQTLPEFFVEQKKHEIGAVFILAGTLLVLFSLSSYNVQDPTPLTFSTTPLPVHNWIGIVGANLAWGLLCLLGVGAYGLPPVGFWIAWSFFTGEDLLPRGTIRIAGIVLFFLSFTALAALHFPSLRFWGPEMQTGGLVGHPLAMFLKHRLESVGAHVVLVAALIVAVLLSTPLTLKAVGTFLLEFLDMAIHEILRLTGAAFKKLFSRNDALPEEDAAETSPTPPAPVQPILNLPRLEVLPPEPTSIPIIVEKKAPRRKPPTPPPEPGEPAAPGLFSPPPVDILEVHEQDEKKRVDPKVLERNSTILQDKLSDFGVQGNVVAVCPGPVITMYEYAPAPGIKISRIVGLSDDLTMALKAISIRVVAPIPGKAAIGIEIPNMHRELVAMRDVIESEAFQASTAPLTITLGKDTTGRPVVANLAKMPHLLIAGATGTGKSVGLNAILCSLLFRNNPEDMRLLLVDPKRIELSSYEGIPQLIHPVVTEPKMATRALGWAVKEMELRYKLLADKNVRNIESYNRLLTREQQEDDGTGPGNDEPGLRHHRLPYLVIVIDELADLMMVASREVEESITRLAQMARAAGIHLILATQRPSVDVLTGIIKANIPTRLSFQVSSRIDSRTILDTGGAEGLLGNGDMLFLPPGTAKLQRIHGAFVSDAEVMRITDHWRDQKPPADPLVERVDFTENASSEETDPEDLDEKYDEAVALVVETGQASISMLQRRLRVGYNRAARMIEIMEQQGLVGRSDGVKPREVIGRPNSGK